MDGCTGSPIMLHDDMSGCRARLREFPAGLGRPQHTAVRGTMCAWCPWRQACLIPRGACLENRARPGTRAVGIDTTATRA